MKKFIITILTAVVGLFGYTIAEESIESRVSQLENRLESLEAVVESYHNTVETTNGELVTGDNTGEPILGCRYNPDGNFYYIDDKECWQENAGYNEVYDQMAPVTAMFIDQIRIRFTYENKDWMIQYWKGQYSWLLIGAEIGVYTAPMGQYTGETGAVNHYNCASKSDWLSMSLDCYWAENDSGHYKKVFSRPYDKYWWATGFVKGRVTKYTAPRDEIKVKSRITFK